MKKLRVLIQTIQTGQIWYCLPHIWYKAAALIRISMTRPVLSQEFGICGALEVHVMTGSKHWVDCVFAAKSFIINYPGVVSLVIHADKTVTPVIIARIQKHIPNARVFTKSERDSLVEPVLENRGLSNCLRFRKCNIFAAKLIDVFLIARSEKILLLDTDCLSFKRLDELANYAKLDSRVHVYSKDPQPHAYSVTLDYAKRYFGVDILPNLCAGFCLLDRRNVDLSLVESWLGAPDYPMKCHYAEQTIHAALSSRGEVVMLDPMDYNTGRTVQEDDASFIHYCGHYLGKTRIAMRRLGQPRVLAQLRARSRRQKTSVNSGS